MSILDPRTVQRLAENIVGQGSPYEMAGWQLERLLAHAGWADPPEYDSYSPRVAWLQEAIEERADDDVAVEQLLCRICDPVEHDGGTVVAEAFREMINQTIARDRLVVTLVGDRPVLAALGLDGSGPQFAEPPDLERRIAALLDDQRAAAVLARRAAETRICEHGGAYTMAIISMGSLVEGLLYRYLVERDPDARSGNFTDREGRVRRMDQPSLEVLLQTAYAKGCIQLDAKKFMDDVRNFRNYIHPRKEFDDQPEFDADSVRLCWSPVQALLLDLEQKSAEDLAASSR